MGFEFELKYRATPEILKKICRELPGTPQEFSMETTYYDTPEGDFSARRCTLRRRLENDVSICTLKTPADNLSRGEWEVESETISEGFAMLCKLAIPEELAALSQKELRPICGARFHRIAKTVTYYDCTVEVAMDSGVLLGGGKELPLCELEVELKEGSRMSCGTYANLLASAYGLEMEQVSKFRRALNLAKGEE